MTRRDYFKRKGRLGFLRQLKRKFHTPLTEEQKQATQYVEARRHNTRCKRCERLSLHGRRPLAWFWAGVKPKALNLRPLILAANIDLIERALTHPEVVPLCRSCVRRVRYGE